VRRAASDAGAQAESGGREAENVNEKDQRGSKLQNVMLERNYKDKKTWK